MGVAVAGIRRDQIPDILAALIAENIRVYRVEHDEPTLEDVYFALHTPQNGVEEKVFV